ncbi:MAG: hypothetical protein IPH35_25790 [Rhodoferax sp.]|nr:hypothetical protein [Rhodoferax sp.]
MCGQSPVLDASVTALIKHLNGRGTRALNRLLQIKRTYPAQPFLAALEQALKYGLFDLTRLESMVLRHVAGDFFALGESSHDNLPNEPDDKDDEQNQKRQRHRPRVRPCTHC